MRSSLLRGGGKVDCKESREYTVIPQAATTERKLVSFSGECLRGNEMVHYSESANGEKTGEPGAERENIAAAMDDVASDPKSRDGIPRKLFPLGTEELKNRVSLKGEARINGRRTFDITFAPAEGKAVCIDAADNRGGVGFHVHVDTAGSEEEREACRPWKGEVRIDSEVYEPVRIDTKPAKGVPWGVRVFLGTNIRQLGFSLTYQRVAAGVWFPATYGTEFSVTLLWGYTRTITMSMENTDFQRTDAQSTVRFGEPE